MKPLKPSPSKSSENGAQIYLNVLSAMNGVTIKKMGFFRSGDDEDCFCIVTDGDHEFNGEKFNIVILAFLMEEVIVKYLYSEDPEFVQYCEAQPEREFSGFLPLQKAPTYDA